jgi:hypothetical protein
VSAAAAAAAAGTAAASENHACLHSTPNTPAFFSFESSMKARAVGSSEKDKFRNTGLSFGSAQMTGTDEGSIDTFVNILSGLISYNEKIEKNERGASFTPLKSIGDEDVRYMCKRLLTRNPDHRLVMRQPLKKEERRVDGPLSGAKQLPLFVKADVALRTEKSSVLNSALLSGGLQDDALLERWYEQGMTNPNGVTMLNPLPESNVGTGYSVNEGSERNDRSKVSGSQ